MIEGLSVLDKLAIILYGVVSFLLGWYGYKIKDRKDASSTLSEVKK